MQQMQQQQMQQQQMQQQMQMQQQQQQQHMMHDPRMLQQQQMFEQYVFACPFILKCCRSKCGVAQYAKISRHHYCAVPVRGANVEVHALCCAHRCVDYAAASGNELLFSSQV